MSRIRKRINKILTAMLTVVLLLLAAPLEVHAELIDIERETTLEVYFNAYGTPIEGIEFRAYRIASINEFAEGMLTSKYKSYPIEFPKKQSGYRALAETVRGYISEDGITPDYAGKTDAEGRYNFGTVDQGLYVVLADPYEFKGKTYIPYPIVTLVPTVGLQGQWVYDVEVSPKYRMYEPSDEPIKIEVLKVWEALNTNGETAHPESVKVKLLCNGEDVGEPVTLNKDNSWRYEWDGLDGSKSYEIVELDVPSGYTVSITKEGTLFTVTNKETPPPETEVPPPPGGTTPKKLPQTGQDWLLVIGLLISGFVLTIIGYIRKKTA